MLLVSWDQEPQEDLGTTVSRVTVRSGLPGTVLACAYCPSIIGIVSFSCFSYPGLGDPDLTQLEGRIPHVKSPGSPWAEMEALTSPLELRSWVPEPLLLL